MATARPGEGARARLRRSGLNQHGAVWLGGLFGETITSRDSAGRILEQETETAASAVQRGYRYDADGRVTEEWRDGVRIASYAYDAQGNRTQLHRYDATTGAETESRAASHDARDRLLDDGAASYTYDAAGRRATKLTRTGDLTRYAYDELGHLVRVELPSGTIVQYTYDALGRRTGRTTDGAVDGLTDTAWVYGAGPAPQAQLDASGRLQLLYVYGTKSWLPDMIIAPDAVGGRVEMVVIADHRGNVRNLVERTSGGNIGAIDYDAFGRAINTIPSTLTRSYYGFAFAGGILDLDTGLLHLGARDYDPETGTWIQPDPIRFGGGDTNLYAYVGSDPVNFADFNGLWEFAFGASGDIVFGLGVTLSAGLNVENNPGGCDTGVYGIVPEPIATNPEKNGGLIISIGASVNISVGQEGASWDGVFNNVALSLPAVSVTIFWGDGPGPQYYGLAVGLGFGAGIAQYQTRYIPIITSKTLQKCGCQ